MEKIVVTRKIPGIEAAVGKLPQEWKVWINPIETPLSREELLTQAKDATAILVAGDVIDEDTLIQLPQVKVLSNYGVGLDNIDLVAAKEHNVQVRNLPDEVTYSTAELTFALMLACARRICEADQLVRDNNPFSWTPTIVIGNNLQGKTLGIVGFGRIGQKVAKIAQAFEMQVIYYNRSRKLEVEADLGVEYRSLDELLQQADVVSLHVPGGTKTHHLIGTRELQLMKQDAILVNVARGSVVDEQALAQALKNNEIGSAGLDVYEHEPKVNPDLLKLANVVLAPHIGTTTWETRQAMTNQAVANIVAVLELF